MTELSTSSAHHDRSQSSVYEERCNQYDSAGHDQEIHASARTRASETQEEQRDSHQDTYGSGVLKEQEFSTFELRHESVRETQGQEMTPVDEEGNSTSEGANNDCSKTVGRHWGDCSSFERHACHRFCARCADEEVLGLRCTFL